MKKRKKEREREREREKERKTERQKHRKRREKEERDEISDILVRTIKQNDGLTFGWELLHKSIKKIDFYLFSTIIHRSYFLTLNTDITRFECFREICTKMASSTF
jgi:hypothetical protein